MTYWFRLYKKSVFVQVIRNKHSQDVVTVSRCHLFGGLPCNLLKNLQKPATNDFLPSLEFNSPIESSIFLSQWLEKDIIRCVINFSRDNRFKFSFFENFSDDVFFQKNSGLTAIGLGISSWVLGTYYLTCLERVWCSFHLHRTNKLKNTYINI